MIWLRWIPVAALSCGVAMSAQMGSAEASASGAEVSPFAVVPSLLLECEGSGPCNGAWKLNGSDGTAMWFARTNVKAKLTVVRFEPDDILIRRTDTTDGNSAVYSGAVRGDRISGTVIWSRPDHPGESSGPWSAAIPQTVCDPGAGLSAQEAIGVAQSGLMFQRWKDALGCYLVAARAGDMTAQTLAGTLYYQGHDPELPQDYGQALVWLKKAAAQGSYAAQRTLAEMYTLGEGTAPNAETAHYYDGKADEQQRLKEREEDRADRQADQTKMLNGFVMGAVFGALMF